MLDKQIQILAVDTGNFYYEDEAILHEKNRVARTERRKLINGYDEKLEDKTIVHHTGTKELLKQLKQCGLSEKEVNQICKSDDLTFSGYDKNIQELLLSYSENLMSISKCVEEAKQTKQELLALLKNRVEYNIQHEGKKLRVLNESSITNNENKYLEKNVISVFDSSFTRMINAVPDQLSLDFMVVQVYYFDIIKDLIYHGFTYRGKKYIYFTSSAGQIRTKKCVFIKESIWKQSEKTIMCGLTIDIINQKGGINPNKYLAYMALSNSATDVWTEFDIDKTIVIDDFETMVAGTYDFVDDTDYSIKRTTGEVPITHTDGAGMMLPCMGKNRMVRLPWIKGLLGVFDFVKFIQTNNCSPIIKDIYGIEHNVIDEGIQIIFCKSQFKMYKYYDNWQEYKDNYKEYNCAAGFTNLEEDRIPDATINYQMLQSLTDITDDEIAQISGESVDRLNNLCSSVENIQQVFGATPYNQDKTALQKSIILYPNLLNDTYIRTKLKEKKDSMIKKYKAGKLRVKGKYTFLLPDFYAACEHWFQGIEKPKGLLADGEVFCWLFRKSKELDCLRSPHLYREHAIRNNIACNQYSQRQKEIREWFCTDAVYTSSYDLISKILQFDVDGDKSLIICDDTLLSVAKRNMQGIVPLYYNMRKASPSILTNEIIYDGLSAAFTGSNIGQYSNSITKIWNSEVFISGTPEEKQQALDVIKLLCMENNFRIDFAKTLYMPERPQFVRELITGFTKSNVPHFFIYAKDKEFEQVENANLSFINKLDNVIPNPRINCKYVNNTKDGKRLSKPDYKLLMTNPDIDVIINKTKSGRLAEGTNLVILKYIELSQLYGYKISNMSLKKDYLPKDVLYKSKLREKLLYGEIVINIKQEFSKFNLDDKEIADILVKYLYGISDSKYKDILWFCYGDILYDNLSRKIKPQKREVQCVNCGKWIEVGKYDTAVCRCKECQIEYRKKYKAEKEKERRIRLRGQRN